ncbi:MAG TPA: NAD(P)-dependent oxidoreductase [Chthoniobacterales bacterium]|nr:NAD(P)-dependent oxidoreductase [Chthoniobacterales bacterium]
MSTTTRVGVIGLGIIGARVAKNLRKAGFDVYVWNRTPKDEPQSVQSPQALAETCQVLQIFVANDAAILETIENLRPALTPQHLLIAHSTISPETIKELKTRIAPTGAHLIDAPFTGSKGAAEKGQLVYYVAAEPTDSERAKPILEATSKHLVFFDHLGDASLVKIATNLITASIVQSLSEAVAITEKAGVDPNKLVEAIEYNACRSGVSDFKLPAILKRDFDPNFSLANMLKDSRLALQLAEKLKLELPVTRTISQLLARADEKGGSAQDFAVVSELVRRYGLRVAGWASGVAPIVRFHAT